MKKQALLCVFAVTFTMAFGGRLSNQLESGTITGNGTAYSFGINGGYKAGPGGGAYNTFTGYANQSAQTGTAWLYVPIHVFAGSISIPAASISISSTYKVFWTETVANEGLPAHLYAKLNVVGNESGSEQVTEPSGGHGDYCAIACTMKVATSTGTGNTLPSSTLSLPSGWSLPWSVIGLSGAPGKQTVTLSPSWTLVNTNPVTGFRTWSTAETIVSPTGSSTITSASVQYAASVYLSDFATFGHGIFFDVTAS